MEAKLKIVRDFIDETSTMGELFLDDEYLCGTLELPYKNNQKGISCVPTGQYSLDWRNSPRFGKVLEVLSVPNRKHILIHAGNTVKDTQGCILVGMERLVISKKLMLSRKALDFLHKRLSYYSSFSLQITE